MNNAASCLAATALVCAVAAGGCGFGPGNASEGRAELRITRDFGTVAMVTSTLDDPTESDTVVRMLDSSADIETSYGDNFVESIDGYAGSTGGGGEEDWFFFVNGYYSDVGAGETRVRPGDRIWWDYRFWASAYRVPAVVGSWPEPFLHGYDGERPSTVVQCLGERVSCIAVTAVLEDEGAEVELEQVGNPARQADELRVLVGPWDALRNDPAAHQLEAGPETSGVYATFERCAGGPQLAIDDSRGRTVERLADGGLIAAVREGEDQPTWVVTGTDAAAAAAAASQFGADALESRYAVAVDDGQALPVPATDASDRPPEGGCR